MQLAGWIQEFLTGRRGHGVTRVVTVLLADRNAEGPGKREREKGTGCPLFLISRFVGHNWAFVAAWRFRSTCCAQFLCPPATPTDCGRRYAKTFLTLPISRITNPP